MEKEQEDRELEEREQLEREEYETDESFDAGPVLECDIGFNVQVMSGRGEGGYRRTRCWCICRADAWRRGVLT